MDLDQSNSRGSRSKSGDLRIETLRGLAILAVVSHHATLYFADALQTSAVSETIIGDLAGYQSGLLQPLRMPLFTVLSGYVYALKPFRAGSGIAFFQGKLRRILIPLLFVATFQYFFDLYVYGQQPAIGGQSPRLIPPSEFWVMWFYKFGHLWFLHALLIIFAIVAVIDWAGWMRSVRQWLFWVGLAALVPYVWSGEGWSGFWSLGKVPDILVFFLVGVGIFRFRYLWARPNIIRGAWVIFAAAMATHVVWKLGHESFNPWPHFVLVGALGPICLLSLNMVFEPLVLIGSYSYTIYLYHGFTFALLLPLLAFLHSAFAQSLSLAGLIALGIAVPIVIDRVAGRIPIARTVLLGRSSAAKVVPVNL